MTRKNRLSTEEHRLYWLDNLRTFMIFLVVVLHAGLVYESSGIPAFFWIVDDPSTNDLSGILNLIIDIFVMPTIFFISGFFVPPSMRARKGSSFLRAKFNRLMIPWVVSVLTLIPLYKVIFLYSRNLPQEHWTTYFHWSNGIWGQNWLWFLPVLFLFNALYVLFSRVNISPAADSPKKTVGAIVLVGCFYAVCMDVLGLQGWTKTVLIDFQNERVLIYFLVFLSGSLCHKLGTFKSERKGKRLYVFLACTAWVPVNLYLFLVIFLLIKPGTVLTSAIGDALLVRLTFLLSLACLLYVSINTFRIYMNKQWRIGQELNASSYYVYIIHVVVMGGIALLMLDSAMPSLLKYVILAMSTYVISSLLVSLYRWVGRRLREQSHSDIDSRLTHSET